MSSPFIYRPLTKEKQDWKSQFSTSNSEVTFMEKKLKTVPLDAMTDKHIGKRGTPGREAFENELRMGLSGDSFDKNSASLSPAQRKELDRRLLLHEHGETTYSPWEEVRGKRVADRQNQ